MASSPAERSKYKLTRSQWVRKGDERPSLEKQYLRYCEYLPEVIRLMADPLEVSGELLQEHNIALATVEQQSPSSNPCNILGIRLERDGAIAHYDVLVGPFVVNLCMLLIDDQADSKPQNIGEGQFGSILAIKGRYREFIAKRLKFEGTPLQLKEEGMSFESFFFDRTVKSTLFECCLCKICSMLGIGPKTNRSFMGFDVVCYRDCAEIYMEQCYSLDERLQTLDLVRVSERLKWCVSVLHNLGFVHRDIKPLNVVCSRTTNELFLCDFGEVMCLRQPPGYLSRTQSAGTPGFMSPAMQNLKHRTGYVDLYENDRYGLVQCISSIDGLCRSSQQYRQRYNKSKRSRWHYDKSMSEQKLNISTEISPATTGYWDIVPYIAELCNPKEGQDKNWQIKESPKLNTVGLSFPELLDQQPRQNEPNFQFLLLAIPFSKLASYLGDCRHYFANTVRQKLLGSFRSKAMNIFNHRRSRIVKTLHSSLAAKHSIQSQIKHSENSSLEQLSCRQCCRPSDLVYMIEQRLLTLGTLEEAARLVNMLNNQKVDYIDKDRYRQLSTVVRCLQEKRTLTCQQRKRMAQSSGFPLDVLVVHTYFYGRAKESLRLILECEQANLLLSVLIIISYAEHYPCEQLELNGLCFEENKHYGQREFFLCAAYQSVVNPQICLALHRKYHHVNTPETENILCLTLSQAFKSLGDTDQVRQYFEQFIQNKERQGDIVNRFLSNIYPVNWEFRNVQVGIEEGQEFSRVRKLDCVLQDRKLQVPPDEIKDFARIEAELNTLISLFEQNIEDPDHDSTRSLVQLYSEKAQVHLRVIYKYSTNTSAFSQHMQSLKQLHAKTMRLLEQHPVFAQENGMLLIHFAEWFRLDGQIPKSQEMLEWAHSSIHSDKCCFSEKFLGLYRHYLLFYWGKGQTIAVERILEKVINLRLLQSIEAQAAHIRRVTIVVIMLCKIGANARAATYFENMLPTMRLQQRRHSQHVEMCVRDLVIEDHYYYGAELLRLSKRDSPADLLRMGEYYLNAGMAKKSLEMLTQLSDEILNNQDRASHAYLQFLAYTRLNDPKLAVCYGHTAFQLYSKLRNETLKESISRLKRRQELESVYTYCTVLVPLAHHLFKQRQQFSAKFFRAFRHAQYNITLGLLSKLSEKTRTKEHDELQLRCVLETNISLKQKIVQVKEFVRKGGSTTKIETIQKLILGNRRWHWLADSLLNNESLKPSNRIQDTNLDMDRRYVDIAQRMIQAKRTKYAQMLIYGSQNGKNSPKAYD